LRSPSISARASAYHLFALVFDHPVIELFDDIAAMEFHAALGNVESALCLRKSDIPRITGNFHKFESDYISLFELGVNGMPAFSLHEKDHVDAGNSGLIAQDGSDRNPLFHGLLRFYHHFGLRLTDDKAERRLPDHLCCQLEMLSFLCLKEVRATDDDAARSYVYAQRDFLARHPGIWLPRFARTLQTTPARTETGDFFLASANALLRIIKSHTSEYEELPDVSGGPVRTFA
jgi:DMSO reductase family type II enzyme chaperone